MVRDSTRLVAARLSILAILRQAIPPSPSREKSQDSEQTSRDRSSALIQIGNPAAGAVFALRTVDRVSIMVSASQRTESVGVAQVDPPSGDGGEHHRPEKAEKESTSSVTVREPKSRASRKAATKRKGKQPDKRRGEGDLSKLPDMPLDIMYEVSLRISPVTSDGIYDDVLRCLQIFAFVHPMDLLRVSWTNKAFRNILAKETSRHVWIASFNNIPKSQRPPLCPEDLTEIAYANLLYNPLCKVRVCLCSTSHG